MSFETFVIIIIVVHAACLVEYNNIQRFKDGGCFSFLDHNLSRIYIGWFDMAKNDSTHMPGAKFTYRNREKH